MRHARAAQEGESRNATDEPVRSGRQSRLNRQYSVLALTALVVLVSAVGLYAVRNYRSVDPEGLWKKGQAALSAGKIDDAEAAAISLSRLREPTPWDRMLLAQVDVARLRTDEAVSQLERIPDDHPAAAQARLLAGRSNYGGNRVRFAEQYLLEAVRLNPKQVAAHRELIYIYGYQLRRRELDAEFRDWLA